MQNLTVGATVTATKARHFPSHFGLCFKLKTAQHTWNDEDLEQSGSLNTSRMSFGGGKGVSGIEAEEKLEWRENLTVLGKCRSSAIEAAHGRIHTFTRNAGTATGSGLWCSKRCQDSRQALAVFFIRVHKELFRFGFGFGLPAAMPVTAGRPWPQPALFIALGAGETSSFILCGYKLSFSFKVELNEALSRYCLLVHQPMARDNETLLPLEPAMLKIPVKYHYHCQLLSRLLSRLLLSVKSKLDDRFVQNTTSTHTNI